MKGAKILVTGKEFFGKPRNVGDMLTAEELSMLTPASISALVSQRIIELDEPGAQGNGMSAESLEVVRAMQASLDTFREKSTASINAMAAAMVDLTGKVEALSTQVAALTSEKPRKGKK